MASIKERGGVVFAFVVVVPGVGCVSCRLSSVVVVVIRFGFKAQQSNGPHVCRESTLDPRRSPPPSSLVFYHHLALLKIWPLSPQWSPGTTRSPLSQAQLPPNHQEEISGDITQFHPLPEYLGLAPSSSKTSNTYGTATRTRLLTSIGWAVWGLWAKNRHRSTDRLPYPPGISNAVRLSFFRTTTPIYLSPDDLSNRSDSPQNSARRHFDPTHTQQSLRHRGP